MRGVKSVIINSKSEKAKLSKPLQLIIPLEITYARYFQYKVLNNVLYVNKNLFLFKKSNSLEISGIN